MAETTEYKVNVEIDTTASMANLKALKKQLRDTAAGSEEFKRISQAIKDVEDGLEEAKFGAKSFVDQLEEAPGPIGALAKGFRQVEIATKSFGAAFKAIGIGLLVSLIGGIAAAFAKTEGSLKKLEPLLIGLEKIFAGIIEVFTPLLDAFLELALKALPYITSGIGKLYSGFVAFFTLIREAGSGVGKILKGIFTLDTKSISEGYDQLKGSWSKTVDSYEAGLARYEAGTKKLTKTEKENLEAQEEARKKALEERIKNLEAQDKLDEARLEKLKAEALAVAKTEQEKLDVEQQFAEKFYQLRLKDLNDKQALYKKDSLEYKQLQTEKEKLEADYILKKAEFSDKQKDINEKDAKAVKDFNDKVAAIRAAAIKSETDRAKAERELKLQQDLANLEEDKQFVKLSEEEKAKIRKDVTERALQDIAKIEEDARQKRIDDELKGIDNQLRLLELNGQNLLQNTKAYFENREQLLKISQDKELKELEKLNLGVEEYEKRRTAIKEKYNRERQKLDQDELAATGAVISQTLDALAGLGAALASQYDEEAKTSEAAFNKRKKLQKATALLSAASGLVQILTQPSVLPSPFDWITKGINAAALAVATAVQIKKIDSVKFEGGSAGGGTAGAPSPTASIAAPRIATTGIPQITGAGTPIDATSRIGETISQRQNAPVRAYVVERDISSSQALARRTNRAATFG